MRMKMFYSEVDVSIHELEEVKKNDIEKEAAMKSLGLKVIRFTNEDIKIRIETCIETIKKLISSTI